MNLIVVLIGAGFIIWGFSYHQFITKQLDLSQDTPRNWIPCEGKAVAVIEKETAIYLAVEFECDGEFVEALASIYRNEDRQAVGKLVYLLADPTNPTLCKIDWQREMNISPRHYKQVGWRTSIVLIAAGVLLLFHGLGNG